MEELKNYSTIGIGNEANVSLPKSEEEFIKKISDLNLHNEQLKVVGNGSNILFGDCKNMSFISTRQIEKKRKLAKNSLYANCSNTLYELYRFTSSHNLAGFERLALIPATLGGAIRNNASCFGQSISDYLTKIKVFDGKKVSWIKKENANFSYHSSGIEYIILGAKFELPSESECKLRQNFSLYRDKRLSSQPVGKSLGSIFKNPPNQSAGKLIEECGLKGFRIGDAQISDIHANIFVNLGNATFEDMLSLINLTKKVVKEKKNIDLECEIEILNTP